MKQLLTIFGLSILLVGFQNCAGGYAPIAQNADGSLSKTEYGVFLKAGSQEAQSGCEALAADPSAFDELARQIAGNSSLQLIRDVSKEEAEAFCNEGGDVIGQETEPRHQPDQTVVDEEGNVVSSTNPDIANADPSEVTEDDILSYIEQNYPGLSFLVL